MKSAKLCGTKNAYWIIPSETKYNNNEFDKWNHISRLQDILSQDTMKIIAAVELLNAIGIKPSRIAIIPVCIQLLTQTPKPQAQVIQPTTEVAPPKLQQEEILMIG